LIQERDGSRYFVGNSATKCIELQKFCVKLEAILAIEQQCIQQNQQWQS